MFPFLLRRDQLSRYDYGTAAVDFTTAGGIAVQWKRVSIAGLPIRSKCCRLPISIGGLRSPGPQRPSTKQG